MSLNLLDKIAGMVWIAEDPHCHVAPPEPCARYDVRAQFGIAELDTQLPLGGLPTGAIHEFFASDARSDFFTQKDLPTTRRRKTQCCSTVSRSTASHSTASHSTGSRSSTPRGAAPVIMPRIIPSLLACSVAIQQTSAHPTTTPSSIPSLSGHSPQAAYPPQATEPPHELTKELPYLLWIGKDTWPSPFLLHQLLGTHFSSDEIEARCIFVDPPNKKIALWAIENALRTPSIAAVVASCSSLSLATSRRFSLAARVHGTLGLLLRSASHIDEATSSYSKWIVRPSSLSSVALDNSTRLSDAHPAWNISLQRIKGSMPQPAEWAVEAREHLPRFLPQNSSFAESLAAHSSGEVHYGNALSADERSARALSLYLSTSVAPRDGLLKNWTSEARLRAS